MPTPEDILSQMRRPTEWDGWVPTYSGKGYRPWSESPGFLCVDDIAWGLAHTYRFGGQSDPALTVAEHCLLVANIIDTLWPGDLDDDEHRLVVAAGLMHDAAESVLHDIQSPLRGKVWVRLPSEDLTWNESDFRVTVNIAKPYGVKKRHLSDARVRAADVLGACFEKRDCKNLDDEADWGLPEIPEQIAHLKMRVYTPEVAFELYRERMRELLRIP